MPGDAGISSFVPGITLVRPSVTGDREVPALDLINGEADRFGGDFN